MPVFVSMLRGVNVGGHNQIKMEALRALLESLGMRDAQTYIQSGNAVFRAEERDSALVARRIGDGIEARFGFRPVVVVRTCSDLKKALAKNPFPAQAAAEPGKLVVVFPGEDARPEARDKVLRINVGPEELRIEGREIYIYYPDGQGRSKLTLPLLERALGTTATARNWNTVAKLFGMAKDLEAS